MRHDYHQGLPGYSDSQILHDGCTECETRGRAPYEAIARMSNHDFTRAWIRACEWKTSQIPDIAIAETATLRVIWSIVLQFERRGTPIGALPADLIPAAEEQAGSDG